MTFTFKLRAGTVPSGQQCLTTVQDVLNKVEQFVTVQAPEGFQVVIIGASTPTTEQQGALWVRLNAGDSTPFGMFTYAEGAWNRVPFCIEGTVTLWSGTVGEIDEGWHICDGADGSPNLQSETSLWKPAYSDSLPGTSYDVCPIIFQGLGS